MKRNKSILKIITYTLYIIISFVILIFILYYSKNKEIKFILSSIGIWFLFFLFCVYKICRARKRAGFFEKGIYDAVDFDDMDGFEFEDLTCDILVANSFEIAESTQNSGDFGVDVIAERDGVVYAIQCKRYHGPVGIDAVQQVYAGRDFYECNVAVVLTNSYFSRAAQRLADKIGVVLWDRDMFKELL